MSLEAYISGVAGRAIIVRGAEVFCIDADDPDNIQKVSLGDIPWLLGERGDILYRRGLEQKAVVSELISIWGRDRALRLIQIVMDAQSNNEIAFEAAQLLEGLFADEALERDTLNKLMSIPYRDCSRNRSFPKEWVRLNSLLSEVHSSQDAIALVRQAFEAVPDSSFDDYSARCAFDLAAIEAGVFTELVRVARDHSTIDGALFDCYRLLKEEKNYRSIINSWTSEFKSAVGKRVIHKESLATQTEVEQEDSKSSNSRETIHQKFKNVTSQKDGVVAQLRSGEPLTARKYAADLVRLQLQRGENSFAAKSLCDLAAQAVLLGFTELAGEWLVEAIQICPSDSWTHGQLGDYYLEIGSYELARQEYQATLLAGDEFHAASGNARLLRASGRLEEAIQLYAELTRRFEGHSEVSRLWVGYSATLRDRWRYDEAICVAEKAVALFPDDPVVRCSYAAALDDGGKLAEAIAVYERATERFPNEQVPFTGLADALRQVGEWERALSILNDAERRFINNPILSAVKAEVLRDSGKLAEALEYYGVSLKRHGAAPALHNGYAETLRQMGRKSDAVVAYRATVLKFPHYLRSLTGLANALRSNGQHEEALQTYDKAAHDFPFDAFALAGRARLLKELGRYEDSIAAYDDVLVKFPTYEYAKYGKASVLAINGSYSDAFNLLPEGTPETRAGWLGLHIKGMLLLKRRLYSEALKTFRDGAASCPIMKDRFIFLTAVALTQMQMGRLRDALGTAEHADASAISNPPYAPMIKLVLAHVLLELNNTQRARIMLSAVNDNALPTAILIRDELLLRLRSRQPDYSRNRWLRDREEELLLQAA